MKKFFAEFKKFITRGNVVDMAVGVIVGSSFTAIVNGLSNYVLKPIINAILALLLGADSLDQLYTYLITKHQVDAETGALILDETGAPVIDLTKSIYIDWGSLINAIINFFLIALVLFCIVKAINKVRENHKNFTESIKKHKPTKEEKKEMKTLGIKRSDKAAVAAYYEEKARKAEEEKKAAEEKARLEREANPTTEELLKQIRDLLIQKNS